MNRAKRVGTNSTETFLISATQVRQKAHFSLPTPEAYRNLLRKGKVLLQDGTSCLVLGSTCAPHIRSLYSPA
jgi:hypothetical protein